MAGGAMHFIRVGEDSTPDDIAEAAMHLRKRQIAETDPVVRRWLSEDIDDCLDLYTASLSRNGRVDGGGLVARPVYR